MGLEKRRHTALVVDDDESMRSMIARVLEHDLGVRPVLAGTCEEALRLAEQREFDVILLDLLMPGVGGFEVLRLLRLKSANVETPVVIVSVLDDKASVDRCMALKAHAFVTKPVNRDVLAGIVRAQLPNGPQPDKRDWRRG
jgi:CheY-like chemotaxis protein